MVVESGIMGRRIDTLLAARLHCPLSERLVAGIIRPTYYCLVPSFWLQKTALGVTLDAGCRESVVTGCPSLEALALYHGLDFRPPYTLLRYRLHPTFKAVASLAGSGSLGMMDEDQGVRQFRLALFGEEISKTHLQSLEYCTVTAKNYAKAKRWHPMLIQGEGA